MNFGGREALLVILVIVLLFGSTKIPELARSLGRGIKEFRKATRDDDEKPPTPPAPPAPPAAPPAQ
ncbi:MAG TPA: twin-arginine translocase TatA/TatE family subunit [Candidatus Saccharimonadales bacterium]|nr:twin-arginine translocase TatA/TatE family subunit [Candidatus Saccharimonadales bacterium]